MTAATGLTPRTRRRVFGDAVAAELSKLLSLPATWLTLSGTLAITVMLSALFGSQASGGRVGSIDSLDVGMAALPYAQAGLFVFGAITTCSEYIGGQIRTTLTAIPDRIAQRLAATVALVLIAFPAVLVTAMSSVVLAAALIGDSANLPDVGVTARVVLGAAAHLTLMVVLASAAGVLIRRALPTAGILVVYLLIVSPLLLGQDWSYLLPDIAGYTLMFSTPPDNAPPAVTAWLIIITWTLALLIPSILIARRRDI